MTKHHVYFSSIIEFRREYNGERTQMYIRQLEMTSSPRSQELQPPFSRISSKQLQDKMKELRIPYDNMNRVFIKQNATSIARCSSHKLLAQVSFMMFVLFRCDNFSDNR